MVESQDKKKFSIYSFLEDKNKDTDIYVEVFNKKMEPEWNFTGIITPFQKEGFTGEALELEIYGVFDTTFSISLSNEGELTILHKIYDDSFKIVADDTYYKYQLYKITRDTKIIDYYIIGNDIVTKTELILRHDNKGNIVLVGYYSDGSNIPRAGLVVVGVYYAKFDAEDLTLLDEKTFEFSEHNHIVEALDGDVYRKNRLIDFYFQDNGSITVASEFKYSIRRDLAAPAEYQLRDLIFINFEPEAGLNWAKNVEKDLYTKLDNILSAWIHFSDNQFQILFNDSDQKQIILGKLDSDGNWTQSIVSNLSKNGNLEHYFLVPQSIRLIDDNKVIGYSQRYKTLRYEIHNRAISGSIE